jgi:hypothetical protein
MVAACLLIPNFCKASFMAPKVKEQFYLTNFVKAYLAAIVYMTCLSDLIGFLNIPKVG